MRSRPVVAIDGPSGAGKSTVTSRLARRLGFLHVDTGAMYRVVALLARREGIESDTDGRLLPLLERLDVSFRQDGEILRVYAGEEEVTDLIRTPDITMFTSRLSASPLVRERLLREQRRLGRDGGVVLEGRDIGTVVFPDAEVKFFLTATPEERARRRFRELSPVCTITYEEVLSQVMVRDIQDQTRSIAPLRHAPDAWLVDSSGRSVEEVVEEMAARVEMVQRRMEERAGGDNHR